MSDVTLEPHGVSIDGDIVEMRSHDLKLDHPARRRRGPSSPHRRALVHDPQDGLTLNWAGDYPGGVTINSATHLPDRAVFGSAPQAPDLEIPDLSERVGLDSDILLVRVPDRLRADVDRYLRDRLRSGLGVEMVDELRGPAVRDHPVHGRGPARSRGGRGATDAPDEEEPHGESLVDLISELVATVAALRVRVALLEERS